MADISAIPQNQLLGRLAGFLRFLEKDRPEFLPSQLGAMQAASKLMLPQASTVENLSYGNLPFTMPPSGTGAMIPQVKTGRKAEVADLVGMITGVPGAKTVADVGTNLSNEAADALVRMITRNQQATAPAVLQETAMPFMNAIVPHQTGLLETDVLQNPLYQLTKKEFLGSPKIISPKSSQDLKPRLLTTNKESPPEPFMGGKFDIKMSEDGAAVMDGDKVIASYNFGKTLVVDPKYRKQGIAEELVYQWRSKYPDVAKADTRTKASQKVQENVWERIQDEKFRKLQPLL